MKGSTESLTDYAETLSDWYIQRHDRTYRKKRGQYFTPKRIAEFMVHQCDDICNKEHIKVLDPGAGMGIFESALCEFLRLRKPNVQISFDLYENDREILPLLELNMQMCQKTMAQTEHNISFRIINKNFILAHAKDCMDGTVEHKQADEDRYDLVICNPPYYKLKKDSDEAIAMRKIIRGQPNIYSLFMATTAKLLKREGQLVFLTPRSYCSGVYFKEFRRWFFNQITPESLHVFESRKLFKKDSVLQEMLILKGTKNSSRGNTVMISSTYSAPDQTATLIRRSVHIEKIAVKRDDDIIIRIPISEIDEIISKEIDSLPFTLTDLGLKVSTGPVVPFRATEYLLSSEDTNAETAPLIWMENIRNGKVIWPLEDSGKARAVRVEKKTERLTIPKGNYVLIKRFSTKEGKKRINAGVLLSKWLNANSIAVENHVNYIYKVNGKLTENEAYGLCEIFNSNLYNRYFQMSNGSTQVDASEVNRIPLPSLDLISKIGAFAKKVKPEEKASRQRCLMTTLGISLAAIEKIICND